MNKDEIIEKLRNGEMSIDDVPLSLLRDKKFAFKAKTESVLGIKKKIQEGKMNIIDIPEDLLQSKRHCLMFADEYVEGIKKRIIRMANVPRWLLSDKDFCFSIKDDCVNEINEGRMRIVDIPNHLLNDVDFCFSIKDAYVQEIKNGKKEIGDLPKALFQRVEFVRELVRIPFPSGYERNYFNEKILKRIPRAFLTDIEILVPYLQQIKKLYTNDDSNHYDMLSYIESRFGRKFLDDNPEMQKALISGEVITEKEIEDRKKRKTQLESPTERKIRIKSVLEVADDSELGDLIDELRITQDDLDDDYIINNLLPRNPRFFQVLSPLKKSNGEFQKFIVKKFPSVKPEIEKYMADIQARRQKDLAYNRQKSRERRQGLRTERTSNDRNASEDLKAEYLEQREKHPDIILILKFLNSGKSRTRFCRDIDITEQDFMNKVNQVGMVYPTLREAVEFVLRQFQEVFKRNTRAIVEDLCSERLTIKEFATNNIGPIKVRGLFNFVKEQGEEEKLKWLILEAMKSGTLSMMDYVRLFSMEISAGDVEKEIRSFFNTLNDSVNEKTSATKQVDNEIDENASEITESDNKTDEKRRYR